MTNQIKEQAKQLRDGVRTPQFWIKGTISAMIGGAFGSISSAMGVMAADITGLDVGDMISIHGILSIGVFGAVWKSAEFLKDFRI